MDRATLVRRGFHLASPVWLVWYWMPPDAGIGMRKELVLLLLLCGALLIEAPDDFGNRIQRMRLISRIFALRAERHEKIFPGCQF